MTGATTVFGQSAAVVQAQTVLFNNTFESIAKAVTALSKAVELGQQSKTVSRVVLRLGDSSALPMLDGGRLEALDRAARGMLAVEYDFFGSNLGSAGGQNRLAEQADDDVDFLWLQNPDVLVAPRLFEAVLGPFDRPGVGQVEARQTPVEHPKDFDPISGSTSWTTGACVMTPRSVFQEVGGYDADSFFLYCDDVDLSWRIREAGYLTLFQPSAVCFHDKRLTNEGNWRPTSAERYYSAEAGLMMAHKWSRPDRVEQILDYFIGSRDDNFEKAARVFLERRANGTLPIPRDPRHEVAEFHALDYAHHRFSL